MSYITLDDLKGEFGEEKLIQLTDDNDTGEIGEDRINKAISYAVGLFDSYARTRYTIPVPVTPLVTSLCLDLAIFHLWKSRATDADDGQYKIRLNAHDSALKRLSDIQSGKAALDVPTVEETITTPASPDRVLRGSDASPSIFNDDNLSSY